MTEPHTDFFNSFRQIQVVDVWIITTVGFSATDRFPSYPGSV